MTRTVLRRFCEFDGERCISLFMKHAHSTFPWLDPRIPLALLRLF